MRPLTVSALVLGLAVVAPHAGAQGAGGAGEGQAPPDGGKAEPAPPEGGGGGAGGYSYSDKPARSGKARAPRKHAGPAVNMPGFATLPDGGSRLFVSLSAPVAVEEHKAQGVLTYVLKGAHVRVRNNTNALVTVHFDTPVSRARLVPHGKDLHFVIELRAAATPTWKMTEAEDKSSVLVIDFPKGDYTAPPATETPSGGTEARPEQGSGAPAKPGGSGAPAPKGPTP